MKRRFLIASLAASLIATAAVAQTPQTSHVRGTVTAIDGRILTVATREGPTMTVTLPEKGGIVAFKKLDLSAIATGTYVGTAAKPGPDGRLQALEVVVFPPAARHSGEGHYPWDLAPGTSMTNANVDAVVQGTSGRELSLSYKGGTAKVTVPEDVPVVTPIPADRADIKAGMTVFLIAVKNPDGSNRTPFVAITKDGVPPPM